MTFRASRHLCQPFALVLALVSCGQAGGSLPSPPEIAGAEIAGAASHVAEGGSALASGGTGGLSQEASVAGTAGTPEPEPTPSTAGTGGGGSGSGGSGGGATLGGEAIIDVHTHFWDLAQDPAFANGKTLLPSDYEELARPAGITGTVLVEAVWRNLDENLWGLDLAEQNPIVVGVIGRLALSATSFEQDLEILAAHRLFRGLRVGAAELAHPNAKLLEKKGLIAEVDVAGSSDDALRVAASAALVPNLKIVLDHAAGLSFAGDPSGPLAEAMKLAASSPNVYCKVSRFQEQSGAIPSPTDALAYAKALDFLVAVFGEDRLMFGTNWPLSEAGGSLGDATHVMEDYFEAQGHSVARKVLHQNAESIYGVMVR